MDSVRAGAARLADILDAFQRDCARLETAMAREGRAQPTGRERDAFVSAFVRCLDALAAGGRRTPPDIGAFERFVDLMCRSDLVWRARFKPHGIAGDFRLIERLCDIAVRPGENPRLSPVENLIEAAVASVQYVRGVQKRAQICEDSIADAFRRRGRLAVLDVCGGAARPFRQAFRRLGRPATLEAVVFNVDPSAARFFETEATEDVAGLVRPISGGLDSLDGLLGEARFDLIVCMSVFERLEAGAARELARRLARRLKPHGRIVAPNVLPTEADNSRFFREAVVDWPAHPRAADALADLFPNPTAVTVERHSHAALAVARAGASEPGVL